MWAQYKLPSKSLRRQTYQGMPLRSGAFEEGSGRSPAMRISAISRTPANPPPTNATNSHHNETICCPLFLWFRENAKALVLGCATDSSNDSGTPGVVVASINVRKKSGISPDGLYCLGTPARGTDFSCTCDFERAGRARVLTFLEPDSLRPLKKSIKKLNARWPAIIIFRENLH